VRRLAVPRAEAPDVSVLMVTFNAWEWTERALAALVEHTDPFYELIVTDNASEDGTLAGLESVDGATVLRNPANLGFGPAVNQAALHARAPHLLLLNTDALVQPGWLPPLRDILDHEPDVAAVAPRLLHLDGTVQEAGSIVWGDGEVWPYGAGQQADRPEFRFRRDVDYASAACLLVRRSAFVDAGGFDPAFAPAYYEDVDLCLRWWSQGLRVVCQPGSNVSHAGGASTDRHRIASLLARNRPLFESRWRRLLARRPAAPAHWEPRDVLPGRDIRCAERILIVGDFVPDSRQPFLHRLVHDLGRLWPRARITHLALDADGAEEAAPPLLDMGIELAWPGEELEPWLGERRHHYGVVVTTSFAAAMPPVRGLLLSTQPLARSVVVVDGRFDGDAEDAGYRDSMAAADLIVCADRRQRGRVAGIAPSAEVTVIDGGMSEDEQRVALVTALAPLGMTPDVRGYGCVTG